MKDHVDVAQDGIVGRLRERSDVGPNRAREIRALEQLPPPRVRLIEHANLGALVDQARHQVRSEKAGRAGDQYAASR